MYIRSPGINSSDSFISLLCLTDSFWFLRIPPTVYLTMPSRCTKNLNASLSTLPTPGTSCQQLLLEYSKTFLKSIPAFSTCFPSVFLQDSIKSDHFKTYTKSCSVSVQNTPKFTHKRLKPKLLIWLHYLPCLRVLWYFSSFSSPWQSNLLTYSAVYATRKTFLELNVWAIFLLPGKLFNIIQLHTPVTFSGRTAENFQYCPAY